MKRTFQTSLLVLIVFATFAVPVYATGVDVKLQAAIFLKALSYDSGIPGRSDKNLVIHVVLDGATSGQKADITAGFATISGASVGGKKVTVDTLTAGELAGAVAKPGVHVIYLPENSAQGTIDAALTLGSTRKIPVLAGSEPIARKGAAIGITIAAGKPQIIVNLKKSVEQGLALSAQFLKLAKVI